MGDPSAILTPKEQACLKLVAQHCSSKEIALALGIAKTSVDTYCDRARSKLGVADRYEAARRLLADLGPLAPEAALAGAEPLATAKPAAALPDAAPQGPRVRSPGPWAIAALLLAAVIALATLLSGLRAIGEVIEPLASQASR